LHAAGHYDGCVYLCGNVVELALKAVVCRALNEPSYPDERVFKTHDFKTLSLLAGVRLALQQATQSNQSLKTNWNLVGGWSPDLRYDVGTSQQDALDFLDATRSKQDGVLNWLQQRW
jgi:hypothetical protein